MKSWGWWGALFLMLGSARAQDVWETVPLAARPSLSVEGRVGEESFRSGAVVALQGATVRLRLVGHPANGETRWFQIVPETARFYKNANHPWEADPYAWVGFGKIDYRMVEILSWRGRTEVEVRPAEDFRQASRSPYYHPDLGSFWFQAQVLADGLRLRSAGLEENGERNLSPAVFRLSIQTDEGYLGCLSGFFNVPGLFGSVPSQSYHYVGVDCADVLVAAHRRWKRLGAGRDANVSMLAQEWTRIAEFPVVGGVPKRAVRWGREVKPGDAIAVRYTPGKAFQHIGALAADRNGNGWLDAADEIIHAGPHALHRTHLREGGFDGEVVILRPPQ
ncbi:MAG: hypothetical protein DVB23_001583 [Verrucomicrobia bacterium]|nr:MAG: hypothetical protein DVB23_001583 [Verrucomicrobiota bacterium]